MPEPRILPIKSMPLAGASAAAGGMFELPAMPSAMPSVRGLLRMLSFMGMPLISSIIATTGAGDDGLAFATAAVPRAVNVVANNAIPVVRSIRFFLMAD